MTHLSKRLETITFIYSKVSRKSKLQIKTSLLQTLYDELVENPLHSFEQEVFFKQVSEMVKP